MRDGAGLPSCGDVSASDSSGCLCGSCGKQRSGCCQSGTGAAYHRCACENCPGTSGRVARTNHDASRSAGGGLRLWRQQRTCA